MVRLLSASFLAGCLVNAAFDSSNYTAMVEIKTGLEVHWKLDADNIHLAIRAPTLGWVGLGIADPNSAGMKGADIVYGWVKDGTVEIFDAYAMGETMPMLDECQSWTLVAGEEVAGVTTLEVMRPLDTGDNQDRPIDLNPSLPPPVIVAYGNTDVFGYHDFRLATRIDLVQKMPTDLLDTLKNDPNVITFELRNNNAIKAESTVYKNDYYRFFQPANDTDVAVCSDGVEANGVEANISQFTNGEFNSCEDYGANIIAGNTNVETSEQVCDLVVNGETLHETNVCDLYCGCLHVKTLPFGSQWQLIAVEHIVENSIAEEHVHHFTLNGYSDNSSEGMNIYGWARGSLPLLYPEQCGFTMGLDGMDYVRLQTHYDNTGQNNVGLADTSGIRVYFTNQTREHECGGMQLAQVPVVIGERTPEVSHFTCVVPDSLHDVTFFNSLLHMHEQGKRMWTTHYRNDMLLDDGITRHKSDFYDGGIQFMMPISVSLKSGDRLETYCVHDLTKAPVWGLASSDEMCIHFLFYYPRVDGEPTCSTMDMAAVIPVPAITSFGTACSTQDHSVNTTTADNKTKINIGVLRDDVDGEDGDYSAACTHSFAAAVAAYLLALVASFF